MTFSCAIFGLRSDKLSCCIESQGDEGKRFVPASITYLNAPYSDVKQREDK
jgi:hypothetical protein